MHQYEQTIKKLEAVKKELAESFQKQVGKLSEVDKEILDIQHYIELKRLDAYSGFMMYKLLKDTLLKRRLIKDEMEKHNLILNSPVSGLNYQALSHKMKEMHEKRTYTPRILKELFK
jgi:hypothetical protein